MMQKVASDVHPMTPERKARLEEAAKHPDEADCSGRRKPSRGLRDRWPDGQKHQRGFGPETGRAALPPIHRVQETLMNLASIYASIGPAGVALIFVAARDCTSRCGIFCTCISFGAT